LFGQTRVDEKSDGGARAQDEREKQGGPQVRHCALFEAAIPRVLHWESRARNPSGGRQVVRRAERSAVVVQSGSL